MGIQFIINRRKNLNIAKSDVDYSENQDANYKEINIFSKNSKLNIIRVRYAVRIGLVSAFTISIVHFFELEQGRWMVYTIFSLTELYSEHCKLRSKQRLEGTAFGVLIVLILFIVIKDTTIRGLIVLTAGYLDSYCTNYRDKMILVTVSVVASVSICNGTVTTAIERIVYVIAGIAISLFFNRFVIQTKKNEIVIS